MLLQHLPHAPDGEVRLFPFFDVSLSVAVFFSLSSSPEVQQTQLRGSPNGLACDETAPSPLHY